MAGSAFRRRADSLVDASSSPTPYGPEVVVECVDKLSDSESVGCCQDCESGLDDEEESRRESLDSVQAIKRGHAQQVEVILGPGLTENMQQPNQAVETAQNLGASPSTFSEKTSLRDDQVFENPIATGSVSGEKNEGGSAEASIAQLLAKAVKPAESGRATLARKLSLRDRIFKQPSAGPVSADDEHIEMARLGENGGDTQKAGTKVTVGKRAQERLSAWAAQAPSAERVEAGIRRVSDDILPELMAHNAEPLPILTREAINMDLRRPHYLEEPLLTRKSMFSIRKVERAEEESKRRKSIHSVHSAKEKSAFSPQSAAITKLASVLQTAKSASVKARSASTQSLRRLLSRKKRKDDDKKASEDAKKSTDVETSAPSPPKQSSKMSLMKHLSSHSLNLMENLKASLSSSPPQHVNDKRGPLHDNEACQSEVEDAHVNESQEDCPNVSEGTSADVSGVEHSKDSDLTASRGRNASAKRRGTGFATTREKTIESDSDSSSDRADGSTPLMKKGNSDSASKKSSQRKKQSDERKSTDDPSTEGKPLAGKKSSDKKRSSSERKVCLSKKSKSRDSVTTPVFQKRKVHFSEDVVALIERGSRWPSMPSVRSAQPRHNRPKARQLTRQYSLDSLSSRYSAMSRESSQDKPLVDS